jgi:3D (Asp-Asp-Asp) domain-containing protein
VSTLDALTSSAATDRSVVAQVRAAAAALREVRRTLALRADELARLADAARGRLAALAEARSERAAFLASVRARRHANAREIVALESAARAAQQRASKLAAVSVRESPPPAARPAPTPVAPTQPTTTSTQAGRTLTVVATGYALTGRTATGIPVGYGVVAVDPSVIPLGSRMTIPGYGEGIAADTGPGVAGAVIDLWFPSVAQADAWGKRTVTITLH